MRTFHDHYLGQGSGLLRRLWRTKVLFSVALLGCVLCARAQETIVYSEGFEENNGGFILGNGTTAGWEWGSPSGTIGPQGANGGAKCWGTVLNGKLPRPSEGSIVSPAISLPTITTEQVLRVRFWAYVSIDGMRDRAEFLVSKDGTSWQSVMQMYQAMDSSTNAAPGWRKYEMALDPSYAGTSIYLRFRAAVNDSSPTFYCGGATDLSGFYVDDIAIIVYHRSGAQKLFGLKAWEDASAWASCPWVAPWNGSSFVAENDIFPVSRNAAGEAVDYYRLVNLPKAEGAQYLFEVQERDTEDSFTDFVSLLQIDHAADVAVAPNQDGALAAYRPGALIGPKSATTTEGTDVLALVSSPDDAGYPAYSGESMVVDFSNANLSQGAVLVLGVKGFVAGTGTERPFAGPPAVVVETLDAGQQWQERGRLLPRFRYSVAAFDLSSYLSAGNGCIRLRSISHSIKYHLVDYVALHPGAQPSYTVAQTGPVAASFGTTDILPRLLARDGNYMKISTGERFSLAFPVAPLNEGQVRDFVFVSKGYYVPKSGSYLIYTWDGSAWALRDSFTFPGTNALKEFDLSLFLPDFEGQYKVRVWQDYQYEPAGIDYVKMSVGGTNAPLEWAWDYRLNQSISNRVWAADGVEDSWSGCPRNRITEYRFTPSVTNLPPTVAPSVRIIEGRWILTWAFSDRDQDSQVQVEIQVWAGPNATGKILWNPAVFVSDTNTVVYAGPTPASGTAYARIRAFDGKDWGPWSEIQLGEGGGGGSCVAPFTLQAYPVETNSLRVRQTGLFYQTVALTNSCTNSISSCVLWIQGLSPDVQVYNASGVSNGIPYLVYNGTLPPGEGFEFAVEYYIANRGSVPNPTFAAEGATPSEPTTPEGKALSLLRFLPWANGTFLVEFGTATNKVYTIQYSSDLNSWKTARPLVQGTGRRVQWIDNGPPKTDSLPSSQTNRYYRIIEAQ